MKKYPPKKVYIKKRKKFIPLSYDEFLRRKAQTHLYTVKKFLPVRGFLVEVSPSIYSEYYKCLEHEEYVESSDIKAGLLSYNALDNDEGNGVEFILLHTDGPDVIFENNYLIEKLHEAISCLSESEQLIIEKIFFEGLSERRLSKEIGVPQRTINDRKRKILRKLKLFLEKL